MSDIEQIDFSTLIWVKKELDETFKRAQAAIEEYVENPEDENQLQFCATYLHQVQGTLKMVELYGAAMVAEEMEQVVKKILNKEVDSEKDAFEVLMRGIILLPDYLERIQLGYKDIPMVLLPLVNDLRTVKGDQLLSESALFNPDLNLGIPEANLRSSFTLSQNQLVQVVKKIRSAYQVCLLNWLKNVDVKANLKKIQIIVDKLKTVITPVDEKQLFWVAGGLFEALINDGLEASVTVKQLAGRLDQSIRMITVPDSKEDNYYKDLTNNLLYYVALADSKDRRINEIQQFFNLSSFISDDKEIEHAQSSLSGKNRELLESVTNVIKEDLMTIQESLDLYNRNDQASASDLESIMDSMRKISDTLGIIGIGVAREKIRDDITLIEGSINGEDKLESDTIMHIAETLLFVESSLDENIMLLGDIKEKSPDEKERSVSSSEMKKIMDTLAKESILNLQKIKHNFIQYIEEPWKKETIESSPKLLKDISGALNMSGYKDVADQIDKIEVYTSKYMLNPDFKPTSNQLNMLAESIASLEYYLEYLSDGIKGEERILDLAKTNIDSLFETLELAEKHKKQPENIDADLDNMSDDDFDMDDFEIDEDLDLNNEIDEESEYDDLLASADMDDDTIKEVTDTSEQLKQEEDLELSFHEEVEVPDLYVTFSDETDDDIKEVFLEEFEEELEHLNSIYPRWEKNPEDQQELLGEIRRIYHTLKGSGRLVGALAIGDLSWVIEDMTNLVLNNSQKLNNSFILVMNKTAEILPAMFEALKTNSIVPAGYYQIIEAANQVIAGNKVTEIIFKDVSQSKVKAAEEITEENSTPETADSNIDVSEDEEQVDTDLDDQQIEIEEDKLIDDEELVDEEEELVDEEDELVDDVELVDEEDDLSVDPVFVEILQQEVEGHLNEISDYLDHTNESGNSKSTEQFIRVIHTLNGAANMASVKSIVEMSTPLEHSAKLTNDLNEEFDSETLIKISEFRTEASNIMKDLARNSNSNEVSLGLNTYFNELVQKLEAKKQATNNPEDDTYDEFDLSNFIDDEPGDDTTEDSPVSISQEESTDLDLDDESLVFELDDNLDEELDALNIELEEVTIDQGDTEEDNEALDLDLDDFDSDEDFDLDLDLEEDSLELDLELDLEDASLDLELEDESGVDFDLELEEESLDLEEDVTDDEELELDLEIDDESLDLELSDESFEQEKEEDDLDENIDLGMIDFEMELEEVTSEEESTKEDSVEEDLAEEVAVDETAEEETAEEETAEEETAEEESTEEETAEEETAEEESTEEETAEEETAEEETAEEETAEEETAEEETAEEETAEEETAEEETAEEETAVEEAAEEEAEEETAEEETAEEEATEEESVEEITYSEDKELPSNIEHISASSGYEQPDESENISNEFDEELLEIFKEEADDILDRTEHVLTELEEKPNDSTLILAIQRDLHTLKGGARMAGLENIGNLGHVLESLLEVVGEENRKVDSTILETLHESFDLLNKMKEDKDFGQTLDVSSTLQKVKHLVGLEDDVIPEESKLDLDYLAPIDPLDIVADDVVEIIEDTLVAKKKSNVLSGNQIKVNSELLDNLVNYAGEVSIYRSRLEQEVGSFRVNLSELGNTVSRIREQLRKLDAETEAQIISTFQTEEDDEGFDPLEMDRFSQLQQLSRSLAESVSDLSSIHSYLDDVARTSDNLLTQQSRVNTELQEGLMETRLVSFNSIVPRLRRLVRTTSKELDKPVKIEVNGAEGEMDKTVLEGVIAPLEHMLRNSLAHGIEQNRKKAKKSEQGLIVIDVRREATEVVISVSDDGAGINREKVRKLGVEKGLIKKGARMSEENIDRLILQSGFSTVDEVSKLAGRGVGMDVVGNQINLLGGTLDIKSTPKVGTTFGIRLPYTLALSSALLVEIAEAVYAIPVSGLEGIIRMSYADYLQKVKDKDFIYEYANEEYQLQELNTLLDIESEVVIENNQIPLVMIRSGDRGVALRVDKILGSREIVVKTVGSQISSVPGIYGATILGDGNVVLILDIIPLSRSYLAKIANLDDSAPIIEIEEIEKDPIIMIVDDSITMRKVGERILRRNEYDVLTAKDGLDALELLGDTIPDVMLLDIEMPRMDGYELAIEMKKEEKYANIPIIMITSRTGEKHRQKAMDLGVDRYLGKPYQEADLLENISELLEAKND